jgi:unsaturated rhamnogalacturonyl hydrolase
MPPFFRTCSRAIIPLICMAFGCAAVAQQIPLSQRMANTATTRWPQGRFTGSGETRQWNYELVTLLNGMNAAWYSTADGAYFRYIKESVDALVSPDGSIQTYDAAANTLDNIALGRQLLLLYRVTRDARYFKAATLLRRQLSTQPRTASGGLWHGQMYPNQMWLDDLYMAEPFYAEYAEVFQEPQDFADITQQFTLIEAHTRDPKSGLLYHAWDESRKQPWSYKTTGASHISWAGGMGWYMMALVDALPFYLPNDPGRAKLIAILNRTAQAVAHVQDPQTGLWYQVMDKPNEKGNYLESSAACMFAYALEKGVRMGYLPPHYLSNASRAWDGIKSRFVKTEADGSITLTSTVKAIGLGGTPYRDGSYDSYVHASVGDNDPNAIGAFLLAATEMENAPEAGFDAHGQTVLVDAWFNSQKRRNAAGQEESFHYKWNDMSDSGNSLLGSIFASYGVALETLYDAPTTKNLEQAQYYVIASPDNPSKNPNPHYARPEDGEQIAAWVKSGGILVMLENDPPNADIEHFNNISDRFGIHFNTVLSHHVVGDDFAAGQIPVQPDGALFHHAHTLYMKDTCTITVSGQARALLTDRGTIVMATAKYGRGTVLAVVDPWLYNEYTDGRRRPPVHDNFAAGREVVRWLIEQQKQQ